MPDQTNRTPIVSPYLGLVVGIIAASTASIIIRFAQTQAASISIAALRLSFASVLLAPLALSQRWYELRALEKNRFWKLVTAGLLLAFHFAAWISSLEYTSVASSVVLVSTTPLWVALISPLFLKESLSRAAIVGLVIAMTGSLLVGAAEGCLLSGEGLICEDAVTIFSGRGLVGNLLALAGAWFAAGYLIIGRRLRTTISLVSYTFLVYGFAAIFLIGLALVTRSPLTDLPAAVYGWCFLMALFPQLLGHSSFNWALKYLPANNVSIALLGEPVSSVILAVIILSETPTTLEVVGGITILVGIYLASRTS